MKAHQSSVKRKINYSIPLELSIESVRAENVSVKTFKPAFLSSEGVVVQNYSLKEEGAVCLQRLLTVVEFIRPDITHVPVSIALGVVFS